MTTRRDFLHGTLGAMGSLAIGGCSGEPAPPPLPRTTRPRSTPSERPNVLFISMDDLNTWASPWGPMESIYAAALKSTPVLPKNPCTRPTLWGRSYSSR